MVAGPEVARIIEEFHNEHYQWGKNRTIHHHEQIPSVQAAFSKDVCSLVSTIEDFGNPFEEESSDLLILDCKEITDEATVDTVKNAQSIGQILLLLKLSFHIFLRSFKTHHMLILYGIGTWKIRTLKGTTRVKHGKGVRRRVVAGALIPSKWMDFLRVDSNKTDLFKFLSNALLDSFSFKEKQLVVTIEDLVYSKPQLQNLALVSPCSHEEADTHMLLHAYHAALHGYHRILVWTVDTDVCSCRTTLGSYYELWLAFGTCKQFRYLPAHEIVNLIGAEKA